MVEVVVQGGAGKRETPASASPLPREREFGPQHRLFVQPVSGSMNCRLPVAQMAVPLLRSEIGLNKVKSKIVSKLCAIRVVTV